MERGQETTYEYDKLGRITSATDELGTISYTYDGCGNVLMVSETDKDGNTQTIRRTYDCMNRVSSYTDYKGNTVKYGYDELGNLISLTYAGGEIVRYKYYDNGALKEVIDTENLVTSYTYDKRGNLLTTQNPDGTTEVNTYDDLGQLATRTLYKAAAGEEGYTKENELYSYTYTYDDWGNITGISYTDNLSDKDKTSDGLVSDAKNETELLASSTMTYDSSNRMITYNGEKIEYDNDGNMTYGPLNRKMVHYEYDCRNRLIRAGDTEYTYDAENIRTATITPEYKEEYITDSSGALSRVLEIDRTYQGDYLLNNEDDTGKKTEHEIYYYGNGLAYEKSYVDNEEEKALIYHYDHLGSTKLVTDIDGKTICRFDYGTYGELLTTEYMSDGSKTTDASRIKFLYNGQLGVITDDNGLYYMRSRYYNPEIKRFINQDILTGSIGNSASLNRYSYVEGNPISYTDPFGLSPLKEIHQHLHKLMYLPFLGKYFAATDAFLYALEGDWGNALMSGLFALPGGQYVLGGLAACQIVGMYVDEFTNDGKRNDALVENFWDGIKDYYGIDDMSTGEIAFWLTTYAVAGGYKYSEAQAAKTAEIAEQALKLELYGKLDPVEPMVDLNHTGGLSAVEEISTVSKGGSASGKNKLALGLSESLDDFALKNGASTWKDFPDPTNWKKGVLDALYDSNTEIIVNLDGVDNPLSSIQRAAGGYGGATDWELLQIKLTPESWDRITWYKDGNVVPNPFEY